MRAPFELAQLVLPGMRERAAAGSSTSARLRPATRRARPTGGGCGGGTVYGMCKAALERFTTGLAAEEHRHGIAVNVLSPAALVATPGVLHHGLAEGVPEEFVEVETMAEAALGLCTGPPSELTGRIAYSRQLQAEIAGRAGGGGGG